MRLWIKWFRYRCQVGGLWDSVQMAVQNCPWEHWPGHLRADNLSCAEKWPPLTVDALHLHAEAGLAEGGVYFLLCRSLLLLHLIVWTKAHLGCYLLCLQPVILLSPALADRVPSAFFRGFALCLHVYSKRSFQQARPSLTRRCPSS